MVIAYVVLCPGATTHLRGARTPWGRWYPSTCSSGSVARAQLSKAAAEAAPAALTMRRMMDLSD